MGVQAKMPLPLAEGEAGYIAGFIDADGSIFVSKRYPNSGRKWHNPYTVIEITVYQKDREILDWIQKVTGIGNVILFDRGKGSFTKQQIFAWKATGAGAVELLRLLEGHVRVKADRLEECLYIVEERDARASS